MISLLAGLSMTGWIDAAGKLDRVRSSPAIQVLGRQAVYTIATAEQSSVGKAIVISETDIDNILRAKAAIFSAVAMMLEQTGLDLIRSGSGVYRRWLRPLPGYRKGGVHRAASRICQEKSTSTSATHP